MRFIDGFGFGEHTMVAALGVTADGMKVPLGVVEGSTENAEMRTGLVAGLAARGLDAARGLLFVVDGGKGLAKAVGDVYGDQAVIARCRRHKQRNVTDHLPEAEGPLVGRKLRAAWANPDPAAARAELDALASALAKKRPGAAASLREGLDETLTVNRLGVTGALLATLESTNPVESMIEVVRDHSRRVKHWTSGEMALRWAAAGMTARRSSRPRSLLAIPTRSPRRMTVRTDADWLPRAERRWQPRTGALRALRFAGGSSYSRVTPSPGPPLAARSGWARACPAWPSARGR